MGVPIRTAAEFLLACAASSGAPLLVPAAVLEYIAGAGPHRFSALGWLAILHLALLGTVAGFVWWHEGSKPWGPVGPPNSSTWCRSSVPCCQP